MDNPRTWRLWASRYEPEPFEGREFKVVGGHPRYIQMHGGTPEQVVATENPDGTYWGWIDDDKTDPVMIQPHRTLFRIQFPYSPEAEAAAGRGEIVRMDILSALGLVSE